MAESDLSDAAINAGRAFLSKLDEFGLQPEAAAWVRYHESVEWRYIVVTRAVDVVGRNKIYSGIIDIFDTIDFGGALTEADVHLVSPYEHWYRLAAAAFRVQGDSIVRMSGNIFNGVIMPDAVVYRFGAPASDAELKERSHRFARLAEDARERARA